MRVLLFFLFLLPGCTTPPEPSPPSTPPSFVARFLPRDLLEREAWADAITDAIEATGREVTEERACAVIAVLEQESGYQADPIVRNLPGIVRQGLKRKFKQLGPAANLAVNAVLKAKVPGSEETFERKVKRLKTESDLDRLFREIQMVLKDRFPAPMAIASLITKLRGQGWLEDFNPVSTAGSMQVKVSYAKKLKEFRSLSDAEVRDKLYTRKGGVLAGTARLLDYEASYDDVLYRFADYNSGVYSSRNAAFQRLLGEAMGRKLVADGDLLSYFPDGGVRDQVTSTLRAMLAFGARHDISDRKVRAAAEEEKSAEFEETEIWKEVRKRKKSPPYARIPNVTLDSPKLSSKRSTEWFAKSVKRRYDRCRERA